MTKSQISFPAPKTEDQRQQRERLWDRLADTSDLEYAVLLAHVLIYEDLCHLLGARLRTDSIPGRMPTFDSVMNLALAGTRFAHERQTLARLNAARNEVAHRTDRKRFNRAARDFAQSAWNNPDPGFALTGFEWPNNQRKRVEKLWIGFILLSAKIEELSEELAK